MKVSLTVPPTLGVHGGGYVQLEETRKALEARSDVDVDRLDPWDDDREFDLVHVFGSTYDYSRVVKILAGRGFPVVVTTIFSSTRPSWQWKLWKRVDPWVPVTTFYGFKRQIYRTADILVVSSEAEENLLTGAYDFEEQKLRRVPIGLDGERFARATPDAFRDAYGLEDFVLQVGRITRNKGQIRLIRALEEMDLELVFVGPKDGLSPEYLREFRRMVDERDWVHYLGPMSGSLLASAYASARVHVLPSLRENPGMVNLEAAAAGCAVVAGPYPALQEYLGERIHYCRPDDVDSIRGAVEVAYREGAPEGLSDHVIENFSWDRAAADLVDVYRELT